MTTTEQGSISVRRVLPSGLIVEITDDGAVARVALNRGLLFGGEQFPADELPAIQQAIEDARAAWVAANGERSQP